MKYRIHKISEATEAEARQLSQISWSSKAYWGYPDDWLELWRKDLSVSPDYLARHYTFALRNLPDQTLIGFCILSEESSHFLEVEHLWILPEFIGKGLGSALLNHALTACISPAHQSVRVIADPNAAAFYESKGFSTVGFYPSEPGDRKLPIMEKIL